MNIARTSANSPLRIDVVTAANAPGKIGMTLCPGKQGESQYGEPWQRDMISDLDAIRGWGAISLVTVMETEEMLALGVASLGTSAQDAGLRWVQIPIKDGQIPDRRFDAVWAETVPALIQELMAGHKIVVHCRGGLGRTGMIACLLLVELGYSPADALLAVRAARAGTVETIEQETFVRGYRCGFWKQARG